MLPVLDGEFFSGEVKRALLGVLRFEVFDENDKPEVPEIQNYHEIQSNLGLMIEQGLYNFNVALNLTEYKLVNMI